MRIKEDHPPLIHHLVDPYDLPEYTQSMRQEWATKPCGPKGQIERFLERDAGFFPHRLLIPRVILQAHDVETIRDELLAGLAQNRYMGIRTVADRRLFFGEKLPWQMEITSKDGVNSFMTSTLDTWHRTASDNNYLITQLILMFNPPEIGTKTPRPNQFVARVQQDFFENNTIIYNDATSRILVEMMIGTNQLRGMDSSFNESSKNVLRLEYIFGATGFMRQKSVQIGLRSFDIQNISQLQLPNLCGEQRDQIVGTLTVMDETVTAPDFQKRLDFFTNIGLNAIEFQGYIDEHTGIPHAFLYGLRGSTDETLTGLAPNAHDYETGTNNRTFID